MTGNPNQPNAATTPEALEMARIKREEKEKRRLAFEAARASLLSSSDAAQPQGKHAPLTRQERREIQEKQRAEKEARKQGLVLLRKDTDSIDERPQRQERGDVGGMPFFQGCPPTLHITETSSQSNFPGSVASSHGPSPPNNSSCTSGNVMMRLVSIDRTRNVHSGTSGNKQSPSENSLGGPGGSAVAQTMIHSSHIHASPTPSPLSSNFLHPAIYQLGIWFRENYILGSNARCTALLLALRAWMTSLVHQQQNATSSPRFDYDAFVATRKPLSQQLTYLTSVRRLSVGMGNAIRLMKQESFKMARKGMSELEVYQALCEFVDTFIQEKIHCFQFRDRLDKFCAPLVENGEVILTYGHCSIIRHLLLRCACEYQRRFHVIIVDAPPLHEGRSLLEALRGQSNLDITYCYLTSMSNTMPHVTKVFLGASAVTSNGEIHSRSGTALVAMTAKHHHLPVIVFCETYKFAHRAWLGSLTHNEQGQRSGLGGFTQYMYDLTPIQFVDVVITEYGPTPPMNIATVVREKEGEDITGNVM